MSLVYTSILCYSTRVTQVTLLIIFTMLTAMNFVQGQADFMVVIDPGHGGKDHGCSGEHSQEKHITLAIAQKLKNTLTNSLPNCQVILTREHDYFISLSERNQLANEHNANIFLSLHCNFHELKSVHGAETYVLSTDNTIGVDEQLLLRENGNQSSNHKIHEGANVIVQQAYAQANLKESIALASIINKHIESYTDIKARTIKQAHFAVLRGLTMPGVLIESGFLSNLSDEAILLSDLGQTQFAQALAKSIEIYYENSIPSFTRSLIANPIVESKYTVQIASINNGYANTSRPEWRSVGNYTIHRSTNNTYTYTVGSFQSPAEAMLKQSELYDMGFRGAFVINEQSLKNQEKIN